MPARLLAALLTLTSLTACAHYGLAGNQGYQLAVETVAVDGDSGLDPAALTRTMVDRLERHGIEALWGGDSNVAVCELDVLRSGATGGAWSPTVRANCTIGATQYTADGHASASIDDTTSGSIRTIQHAAATRAVVAVSDKIAADLNGTRSSNGEEK